jgi:hypothetical protein
MLAGHDNFTGDIIRASEVDTLPRSPICKAIKMKMNNDNIKNFLTWIGSIRNFMMALQEKKHQFIELLKTFSKLG